ncbi:hypothetical protein BCR35DRAFT_298082 [Leucosporidium creatinivorum]|uniref:F-box domain-containing protein n=1 Tax=Leucosporidium creatinivorum TaxID=106004 RepID=A0A1Y2G3U5_9BASI|nr:hypothetical protein BCR35DRAFT_298082 [Leucosporidium creatinivorum]
MDSSASPLRNAPTVSLASLPPELLEQCINLALPPLSFKTFRRRYSILLNFSRVNRTWAELAQRALQRHVLLYTKDGARSFQAVKQQPGASGMVTKSLRVKEGMPDRGEPLSVSQMEALVQALPGMRTLQLAWEYGAAPRLDLGALLEKAQALEELVIDYYRFVPPTLASKALHLPSLRRLVISFPQDPCDVTSVLPAAQLPNLNSLVLVFGCDLPQERHPCLAAALVSHAPRLRSFTISFVNDCPPFALPLQVWRNFVVLQELSLDHNDDLTILPHLSSSLVVLRIRPPFNE